MNAKIAIVASAHRPRNWMALYNSIGDNDIEFELVFVGPNSPDFEVPKNFRFIKSLVKPPQCVEIAVRNTTADLMMNMADDCEFYTPRPLDKLYNLYKSCNSDNVIVSSRFMQNGERMSLSIHHFFSGYGSTLVVPMCGLMSKKLYHDIGGIDKNFEAIFWEIDIAMRIYALGGKVVMSDVYVNEDKNKCEEPERDLWYQSGVRDRKLLEGLWTIDGKIHLNRKNPVESFSDMNILKASQGPRGRWRGNGFLLLERIEDSLQREWSIPGRAFRAICKPCNYFDYAKRMALYVKKVLLYGKNW